MTTILYHDLETTGLIDKHRHMSDPSQPRAVQIGALLCDDETVVSTLGLIVDPGVAIPVGTSNVHGITTEVASKFGVTEVAALGALLRVAQKADVVVGYNSDNFDKLIVDGSLLRLGLDKQAIEWRAMNHVDALPPMVDLIKLPPTGRMIAAGMVDHFKTPKLSEAYEFVTGKPLDGAHGALADCYGLKAVYEWWLRQGATDGAA